MHAGTLSLSSTHALAATQAAYGLLAGAYLPFFAAALQSRGLMAAEIGLLLALAMALRILIAPLAGLIADARDDRRMVMLVFTALAFATFVLFALASDTRAIFYLGLTALVLWISTSPLLESATLRGAEQAGRSYGAVRLWLSISFVAGNLLSGLLSERFGYGIIAPWLAVAAGLQLCTILALPASSGFAKPGSLARPFLTTFAEAKELIRQPVFLLFLTACGLIQGSHIFYYSYAGLHWHAQGYGPAAIGFLWPLGVLAEILLFAFSARVIRRAGALPMMLVGALACALRWTLMAFDPPLGWLIAIQWLHGFTFAVPHLGAMTFILKATPARLSATAQSLYGVVAIGAASSLALLPAGYFYAAWGGRTYLLMSAMAVAAAILCLWLRTLWHGGQLTSYE